MALTQTFISYSRTDSEQFAIKLANQLREVGAKIWLDKLDILPGLRWDAEIEKALLESDALLVVLSPKAIASNNVMDEISYAIEEGKKVIPIVISECSIPYRLRRFQHIDFSKNYDLGFNDLLKVLELTNKQPEQIINKNNPNIKIPVIDDNGKKVLAVAVGIETIGGVFTKIIPEGSILPSYRTEVFSTASDNQPAIQLHILSGLHSMVKNNQSLGLFNLNGIDPAPRGVPQIEVRFDLDLTGRLEVKATNLKTKKQVSVTTS